MIDAGSDYWAIQLEIKFLLISCILTTNNKKEKLIIENILNK